MVYGAMNHLATGPAFQIPQGYLTVALEPFFHSMGCYFFTI